MSATLALGLLLAAITLLAIEIRLPELGQEAGGAALVDALRGL